MKKPPCPVCRSRTYRKDSAGFYVCQYGHQLTSYVEERGDDDAEAASNARRRASGRRSQSRERKRKAKEFKHDTPFSVICEVFQWSLKLQVQAIIKIQGLSEELELVVLDLWSLYVTALEVDFEDRRRNHLNWRPSSQQSSVPPSSGDESVNASDAYSDSGRRGKRRRRSRSRTPNVSTDGESEAEVEYLRVMQNILPYYSLVLCHLGCLLLRVPILLKDLHRWSISGDIPYFFTATDLPSELTSRFNLYRSGIERKVVPSVSEMFDASGSFRRLFEEKFGIAFPPVNAPLLWIRTLKELCLPVTFYSDMAVLYRLLSGFKRGGKHLRHGEVWHGALALVIFKLRCGADHDSKEMQKWINHLATRKDGQPPYATWSTSDIDNQDLRGRKEYIKNFARALLRRGAKQKGAEIFEAACAPREQSESFQSTNEPLQPANRQTRSYPPLSDLAGSDYISYVGRDPAGEFHSPYGIVQGKCADMLGVDALDLEGKVRRIEKQLKVELLWIRDIIRDHRSDQGVSNPPHCTSGA
ncbi:uncharacterized protein SPPG_01470 [Spizellomyces punctatus DAOM BR117]|uniref:Uncharacterized protein n=1 Tax=Spizellomyces punctatus (strain DAOM BR117) TaxID=645134 RepID=A0A0L0HSC1_SPIPD|nr:uncharacterized protein SPPG_01470 [Spizellomyces punctatus DAOM BR117]KND04023.1 hypothetical protein SPPG_01470 [Spizellomyces punctatus DAOM BR117]|eukprot:XP_016612062.1 hypothetical protein SPPG_01470 [Spizellomyces punctatus DAOM BR117]